MTHANDYDLTIIGGGLVGASLAVALAGTDWRVALIDQQALRRLSDEADEDERSLALSWQSGKIFQRLGVWEAIAQRAAPMRTVHVSQQGSFGVTRLRAADLRVGALGHVVPYRHLAATLNARIEGQTNLTRLAPARLAGLRATPGGVAVDLDQEGKTTTLTTRLLVGADGGRSNVRQHLGMPARETAYHQQAIVANITVSHGPDKVAFERFTAEGPMAMLPLGESRYSLVWTGDEATTARRMALPDGAFLDALQRAFGYYAGRLISAGRRETFPLRQAVATRVTSRRCALVGNAAHLLHPVAGQGLNLALRDVAALASLLASANDPGHPDLLARYAQLRMTDIRLTAEATDKLIRLFADPSALMRHQRGAGLCLLDKLPPVKNRLARFGMGLRRPLAAQLGSLP
ncbi:MAG TPA: 2-octaprenyl-6-methoxyphenyl hydroxylase [Gammaproteobacteria bacterium]|nr:2-octaprenyl-6-methoxyphenyl hydroxylase [Gammaproteobacteria bacterium]